MSDKILRLKIFVKRRLDSLRRRPVFWGNLRRRRPISRVFGFDRGTPIDRYYIEGFLEKNRHEIQGRVLEFGDDAYTKKFGHAVTRGDVVCPVAGPGVTIVADITQEDRLPANAFDCIICTQTLPFIYDVAAAVQKLYAALKPGGVMLVTLPCISQISRYDMDRWGDYWRFTRLSAQRLFEGVFGAAGVQIDEHGSVLTATAFLQGISAEELRAAELNFQDPDYPLTITIIARKGAK